MAVTKTHPIKSTLKAAIDYICNPEKTDGKLLVSAYGCAAETADIEFSWTRRHAIDKGTNLGRHLIQAFQPGEVTPEQAHEIGMELAKEILGGKYEFVLTTHAPLRTDELALDQVPQDHFQRLSVFLIEGKQEEREHDKDHAQRRRGRTPAALAQKEKRHSHKRRRSETHKLPLRQAEQHLAFDFCQVLRDRYVCQN